MNEQLEKVIDSLLRNKSVVLVGSTNSGKSYWVEHYLIPVLGKSKKIAYFKEAEDIQKIEADIFIFDEAETFFDKEFLRKRYPEKNPYYAPSYVKRVKNWHELYKKLNKPSLYIITRNSDEEVDYLVQNFNHTDWDNREILTLKF